MRILAVLLFCLATLNGYAQDEKLKQLEILQTICTSLATDQADSIDSMDNCLGHFLNLPTNEASPKALALDLDHHFDLNAKRVDLNARRAPVFETYAVRIDFFEGHRFHVADYYDGTCVVTCLDGPLLGYQVISVHGVVTADSSDVIWRKNHFVHRYPSGKVFTYERMQVIELK